MYFFRVTEAVFVGWFTLEYTIRFMVSPRKVLTSYPGISRSNLFLTFQSEFIFSFLNIIDLLGILPFYVSVFLNLLSSKYSLEYIAKAAQITLELPSISYVAVVFSIFIAVVVTASACTRYALPLN